ncbi:MAG: NAD(P)H-quinone oxidoreductase [Betaproteobacteria bacterium]|nr:NAD(P)H-quinone oxidoreductase [Betaproteobacteria bacterium]NBT75223.1 NAD(P)H-quinone oxidoreductase [Betaproteobacteria bacterium]NBY14169.1 NAD(P)H-quinone oxidoreductase [Betaproteobacteria bacterium]NCA16302.1 NAD(P)H-quinone oxidoreductase [Betaproteobacteria bacterium]
MRAIDHRPGGDVSCIRLTDLEAPTPRAGELAIRVSYAGVNRPDLLQRLGQYPAPPDASPLMGLEVSGEVISAGNPLHQHLVGTRVCALTPGGGYAEVVTAPVAHCLPIPRGLDLRTAACLPETMLTVWANLIERGQLRAGQRVLIHGGSSGIGTTAIQFARWAGAQQIFTTVGSPEKALVCSELGAHRAILYKTEDFQQIIKDETQGEGVHLVLDMVGGPYMSKHLRCLAPDGRLVQIGFMAGSEATLDWSLLLVKRLTLTGSTLRARSHDEKARLCKSLQTSIWPELEKGRLLPLIHAEFPLEDAARAHALMESSSHIGKIVLRVNP